MTRLARIKPTGDGRSLAHRKNGSGRNPGSRLSNRSLLQRNFAVRLEAAFFFLAAVSTRARAGGFLAGVPVQPGSTRKSRDLADLLLVAADRDVTRLI